MDRQSLEKAISYYRDRLGDISNPDRLSEARTLIEAAEKHLATLPRKVKVTRYVVILSSGGSGYFYSTPDNARDQWGDRLDNGCAHLVELTGEYETTVPA